MTNFPSGPYSTTETLLTIGVEFRTSLATGTGLAASMIAISPTRVLSDSGVETCIALFAKAEFRRSLLLKFQRPATDADSKSVENVIEALKETFLSQP